MENLDPLKYPIGQYQHPNQPSIQDIKLWLDELKIFPQILKETLQKLNSKQLQTSYRPGGWTACQVVHHLADSHANAYIRLKLGLTENQPLVKPYQEEIWAELPDAKHLDYSSSLAILEGIHARLVACGDMMKEQDFTRLYQHPDFPEPLPLHFLFGNYAWHGRHHLAQIRLIK